MGGGVHAGRDAGDPGGFARRRGWRWDVEFFIDSGCKNISPSKG